MEPEKKWLTEEERWNMGANDVTTLAPGSDK